jgi:peroxiredoxin
MTKPITNPLLALILSVPLLACAGSGPEPGKAAPDFTASDSHGETHRLTDYRGRVVVLEWTNHDCPYVRKHYDGGNMQALQREAAADGVVWLSVISSAPGKQGHVGPAEANRLTESRDAAPAAVLLDPAGEVGRLYGARTTPHLYVIDRDGVLAYMGGIDSIPSSSPADIPRAVPYARNAVAQVLAGEPVSEPVTRPYGCSVKY